MGLTGNQFRSDASLGVGGLAGRSGRGLAAGQHGGLEVWVAAGVLDQVVAAHEALVAQRAQEALLPGVGAGVAGQLVGAGELLLAFGPGAGEGPLACSGAQTSVRREGRAS